MESRAKMDWENYQHLVIEGFRGWEEGMAQLLAGKDGEETASLGTMETDVLWASETGIGRRSKG